MDKYIDKLIDSPWFIKIIALVLALMLFGNVYDPNKDETDVNVPSEQDTETITDVPVKTYYDTENLVVSGVPETVSLTVKGPKSYLQPAKAQKNFEVYVNLADAEIGTQRVPIKIKGISDKLKVTIQPQYATVSIQEKVSKEFRVEAEFNKSALANGYESEAPVVEPNKVKITGAKDVIDQISYVKATVDIKGTLNDTFTREANIRVLDKELNKLNVIVDPESVNVTVPIKSTSKKVPIKIVQKGSPPEGVTIEGIDLEEDEAVIIGSQDILKATESVRVEVDVSKIDKDTTLNLPVIISEGIVEVSPQMAKVNIKVSKEKDRTLSNIPIKTEGLSEPYSVVFKDPSLGVVDLIVSGPDDLVGQVEEKDFDVFIDISNLEEGDHDIKINVDGPKGIKWSLAKDTAEITITKKEA